MQFSSVILAAYVLAGPIYSDCEEPNPSDIYIAGINYGGTGCPHGTVSAAFTSDKKSFKLDFDKFVAQTGRGLRPSDALKTCQVTVDLRYPPGWSYSVVKVDYSGYVGIPAGLTALQTATYYFSGQTGEYVSSTYFNGPKYENYRITDLINVTKYTWSPCGSVLLGNIKAAVELRGDTSKPGLLTVDSVGGKVTHDYALQWRKC